MNMMRRVRVLKLYEIAELMAAMNLAAMNLVAMNLVAMNLKRILWQRFKRKQLNNAIALPEISHRQVVKRYLLSGG